MFSLIRFVFLVCIIFALDFLHFTMTHKIRVTQTHMVGWQNETDTQSISTEYTLDPSEVFLK